MSGKIGSKIRYCQGDTQTLKVGRSKGVVNGESYQVVFKFVLETDLPKSTTLNGLDEFFKSLVFVLDVVRQGSSNGKSDVKRYLFRTETTSDSTDASGTHQDFLSTVVGVHLPLFDGSTHPVKPTVDCSFLKYVSGSPELS